MCEYLPHSKVPLVVGHKLGTNGNLKMGVLRADEARWDEALALYDRALQYCEQMRVTLYLPDIYLNRSEALIGKGELVEARKCLEKSLDLNRQYGQTVSLGEALYEMGELEWDMGQSEAALDPLREGVLSPEEAPRSPLRHVLSRSLGTIRTVEPQIDSCDWQDGDRLL
ncbi:MAG: tetratricopeptide (TPR) repeat protein, partial [Candidatus Latescibacterota bacterium]